jgi:hypothetical protein
LFNFFSSLLRNPTCSERMTSSIIKGRTVFRGNLFKRKSLLGYISSKPTCLETLFYKMVTRTMGERSTYLAFVSPSDKDVATDDPGCVMKKPLPALSCRSISQSCSCPHIISCRKLSKKCSGI